LIWEWVHFSIFLSFYWESGNIYFGNHLSNDNLSKVFQFPNNWVCSDVCSLKIISFKNSVEKKVVHFHLLSYSYKITFTFLSSEHITTSFVPVCFSPNSTKNNYYWLIFTNSYKPKSQVCLKYRTQSVSICNLINQTNWIINLSFFIVTILWVWNVPQRPMD
jgi:hypothetical protein